MGIAKLCHVHTYWYLSTVLTKANGKKKQQKIEKTQTFYINDNIIFNWFL